MKSYPFFTAAELRCKCGQCNGEMDEAFMLNLVAMRREAAFPFILTSAYRCPAHNASVSKTGLTGPHTTGKAVDIWVFGRKADWIIDNMRRHKMTGRGIRQHGDYMKRIIHVDSLEDSVLHPRPITWSY